MFTILRLLCFPTANQFPSFISQSPMCGIFPCPVHTWETTSLIHGAGSSLTKIYKLLKIDINVCSGRIWEGWTLWEWLQETFIIMFGTNHWSSSHWWYDKKSSVPQKSRLLMTQEQVANGLANNSVPKYNTILWITSEMILIFRIILHPSRLHIAHKSTSGTC